MGHSPVNVRAAGGGREGKPGIDGDLTDSTEFNVMGTVDRRSILSTSCSKISDSFLPSMSTNSL